MAETTTWKGHETYSYGNWGSSGNWDLRVPQAEDDVAVTTGTTMSHSSDLNLQTVNRTARDLNFDFSNSVGHFSFRPGASSSNISLSLRHVETAAGSSRLIFRKSQETNVGRLSVGLSGDLALDSALELGNTTGATTHESSSLQQFHVTGVTILNAAGSLTLSRISGNVTATEAVHLGTLSMNGGSLFLTGGSGNNGSSTSVENVVNVSHVEGTTGTISANKAGTSAALVIDGDGSGVYGGTISDGLGEVRVIKEGEGSQTLTAVHAYSGATLISEGELVLEGSASINATSGVTIDGGTLVQNSSTALDAPVTWQSGTVAGNGVIGGSLNGSGTEAKWIDLARSPALFSVGGDVSLDAYTTLRIALNGTALETQYSHLLTGGLLSLDQSVLQLELGFTPQVGDLFSIASYAARDGTFKGLEQGAWFTVGGTLFQIEYGSEEITLQVVPEPGTFALSFAVLAGVLGIRWRRLCFGRKVRVC